VFLAQNVDSPEEHAGQRIVRRKLNIKRDRMGLSRQSVELARIRKQALRDETEARF